MTHPHEKSGGQFVSVARARYNRGSEVRRGSWGRSVRHKRFEARLRASVRGLVQGVSFRYYTLHRAREMSLCGFVRNLWDGSVEVVAEGPRQSLEELLSWLHQGPPAAQVDQVAASWEQPSGEFVRFEVTS